MPILPDQLLSNHVSPLVHLRVLGPEYGPLSAADLKRLFRGRRLTPARRARLAQSSRIVGVCGNLIVGVAAYERADTELRVHEFGVDTELSACGPGSVVNALLEALEVACLAGGGRRLVLLPRAVIADGVLRQRGYVTIAAGCAGSWLEKVLP